MPSDDTPDSFSVRTLASVAWDAEPAVSFAGKTLDEAFAALFADYETHACEVPDAV